MSRPVVLVVDPEMDITCQMADDLRARFRGIHLLTANSEARGKEVALRLKKDKRRLALLITEQNYQKLAAEIVDIHPDVKRVLLTPFSEKQRAIQAMAERLADDYVVKPWLPTADRLYPVISDQLEDWAAANDPKTEAIRLYGFRWTAESHQLKDFLARNQAPYEWVDVSENESDPGVEELLKSGVSFPCVVLPDGTRLECPTVAELGERIGLKADPESSYYDFIIVGGGPAGLAAAVYAASEGLKTVVVEAEAPGGQAGCSTMIENYLGFPQGLSGADLARRAKDQAERFHVEILTPQTGTGLRASGGYRKVRLATGEEISGRVVLLSMGVSYRRLDVPGEEEHYGRGVYYGASYSEALECEQEQVAIVGGGNSAGQATLHFAQFAKHVTLITTSTLESGMSHYLVERIKASPNVEVLESAHVEELLGEDNLSAIRVDGKDIPATSVFVFVGADPRTDWLPREIVRDENGFLVTGNDVLRKPGSRWPLKRAPMHLETSMPGVFAAGDVKAGATRRIASAVGAGAAAVQLVHEYLRELKA